MPKVTFDDMHEAVALHEESAIGRDHMLFEVSVGMLSMAKNHWPADVPLTPDNEMLVADIAAEIMINHIRWLNDKHPPEHINIRTADGPCNHARARGDDVLYSSRSGKRIRFSCAQCGAYMFPVLVEPDGVTRLEWRQEPERRVVGCSVELVE